MKIKYCVKIQKGNTFYIIVVDKPFIRRFGHLPSLVSQLSFKTTL